MIWFLLIWNIFLTGGVLFHSHSHFHIVRRRGDGA
jgi:hypothetical protein